MKHLCLILVTLLVGCGAQVASEGIDWDGGYLDDASHDFVGLGVDRYCAKGQCLTVWSADPRGFDHETPEGFERVDVTILDAERTRICSGVTCSDLTRVYDAPVPKPHP